MEIKYSIFSSVLFALAGVFMAFLWQKGFTRIYLNFDRYGYAYLLGSIIIVAVIHEFYFYWTHRWMHQPAVFKRVHLVHHLSRDTSPWASFSFHPLEAVILAAFLPLIVILLPLHPVVIIAYMVFMTISAISNHLGVEMLKNRWVLQHFISGTHHSAHHKRMNANYGLYFCFMDRLFRTEHVTREK
ncbi:sterol desaturase family protein [Bdellovibrio bacteriovorus]|nr:sterol desaturase family protein [Bdellovibrio bacteriovorus]